MITKRVFKLHSLSFSQLSFSKRLFSQLSGSDTESDIRPKIDPLRKQVTDFLHNTRQYEDQLADTLTPYYFEGQKLKGCATAEGTDKYYRMSQYEDLNLEVHPDHFKTLFNSEIKISSIGYGSYIGDPDDYTDFRMYDAIKTSVLSGGLNHIDTAPNYRYQKSEETIGKAITTLDNKYGITRDQLIVASKVGYIPENAAKMISKRDMIEKLIKDLKVEENEIVKESGHCMHPNYIKYQLQESLNRLNLETLDIYYLQNSYEAQGPYNTDNTYFDRLTRAFETLEQLVADNKIKSYGLATYSCFRVKPTEDKIHLNLEKVLKIAEKVGGTNHNLRYIQVPISILMPEAFVEPYQLAEDLNNPGVQKQKLLLGLCTEREINVISSQPLLQGYLSNTPLSRMNNGVFNVPARHLQFVRSIPAKALKSTVVGMKKQSNVRANLEVIQKPMMTREEFFDALKPYRRNEFIEEELDM